MRSIILLVVARGLCKPVAGEERGNKMRKQVKWVPTSSVHCRARVAKLPAGWCLLVCGCSGKVSADANHKVLLKGAIRISDLCWQGFQQMSGSIFSGSTEAGFSRW